jgi:hypothetical protein
MRRPRYKLQVSTFPFLAVLLCAMGSLLLFLFIMDRRAKIAAQHANDEALLARKKRTKDEEDALQADWEKAKEKLHQALLLQEGQLAAQAQVLQIDLDSAGKKLHLIQTQYHDLDEQAKAEAAKIAEIQVQIVGRRKSLLDADKKETMSKKELLAAAQELAELEIAFQQLLTLKEREKQVHSLVPYHGKRGDSRTPIYIECTREGVVFHPDDKILRGFDLSAGAVRTELERRAGPLIPAKKSDADKKGAYVLFLVRPSGITNYYLAQAAVKGYRLDFGYELIDQDWQLDFGGTHIVKNGPISTPAKRNEMPIDTRPVIDPPPIYPSIPASPAVSGPPSIGPISPGVTGSPAIGPISPGLTGPPSIGPISPGVTGPPSIGPASPGVTGPPSIGLGQEPGGVPRFGDGNATPGSGVPSGSGGKGPAFVPISKILPPVPIASSDGPFSGWPGNPGGIGPYPGIGTGPNIGTGQSTPGGTPNNAGSGTGQNPPGGPIDPNDSGRAPPASNPNAAAQNPGNGPAAQGNAGGAPVTPNTGGQPQQGSGQAAAGNVEGGGPVGLPMTFGNSDKTPKKDVAGPVLSRMLGNKDFLITIECYSDFVNVSPGGMSFRWTASNMKSADQAFAKAIAKLIERRQASVRAGEPPYRPVICFRVTADGRPMCLHAYPLLESLHVPMTRENVVD